MTILSVAFAHLLETDVPWAAPAWMKSTPTWLLVGATFVLMDGCNWLAHYADHRFDVAVASPCPSSLAGGAQRPHVVPGTSAEPSSRVHAGGRPAVRPPGLPSRARPDLAVCVPRHHSPCQPRLVVRPARAHPGQPRLSPTASCGRTRTSAGTSGSSSRCGTCSSVGPTSRLRADQSARPGSGADRSRSSRPKATGGVRSCSSSNWPSRSSPVLGPGSQIAVAATWTVPLDEGSGRLRWPDARPVSERPARFGYASSDQRVRPRRRRRWPRRLRHGSEPAVAPRLRRGRLGPDDRTGHSRLRRRRHRV